MVHPEYPDNLHLIVHLINQIKKIKCHHMSHKMRHMMKTHDLFKKLKITVMYDNSAMIMFSVIFQMPSDSECFAI